MAELIGVLVVGFILFKIIALIGSFFNNLTIASSNGDIKGMAGKESYFGPPELKIVDETLEESGWMVKQIMFRGRLPNTRDMDLAFGISIFDITDGEDAAGPVLSLVETAQEETSICFYRGGEFGRLDTGTAITSWFKLGVVIPDLIQCAYSGNRQLQIVVRMFNFNDPPTIYGGLSEDGEIILSKTLSFNHIFTDKGYEEETKDKEESQALSLKIGVAVAMSDGVLDDSEGEILKNWIIKEVSVFSDVKQKKLKSIFNNALKEAFVEAKEGNLSLSMLVDRLTEIGDKQTKYAAVELCLDVMAADGVAAPEEMSIIRNVAKSLDLNMDEIEKMREKVTLDLSTELTSEEGLEALVGIDQSWSDEEKSKFIRSEFQKWSNRLNTLSEGQERDSAQSMLDNIAIIRKKYG
jgi:tellurite resistance protein